METKESRLAELEYKFTNDTLFKVLFVKYQGLLKDLVANLLSIDTDSIMDFEVTNPNIPPEALEEKFCELDIKMTVDGQKVDLEVQVANERNYPERSLYYWARSYSSALPAGNNYSRLPRTIVISILAFSLFECTWYHSEFDLREVRRNEPLTDRLNLQYYELPKLPDTLDPNDQKHLWLKLFEAKTENQLQRIEQLGVPVMEQVIQAYRTVTGTKEFRELEELRSRARHNEASALDHARWQQDQIWQPKVDELTSIIAEKDAIIAKLMAERNNGNSR